MSGLKNNWKVVSALVMLAGLAYFMVFHWSRFLSDFWPIDHSNVGPNLVASLVQYAVIAITVVLLYPPFRKAAEKWAARHVQSIKHHVSEEHDALHEKLDHMMKHHPRKEVREFAPSKDRPVR